MIPDGRVVVMAGLDADFPWFFLNKIEVFSKVDGWHTIKNVDRWLPPSPRLHLLPSGEIFFAGGFNNTFYDFPFSVYGFPSATFNVETKKWNLIGNPHNLNREEGTSVLLPLIPPDYKARVLLIGGSTPQGMMSTSDVAIIDFSDDVPQYQPAPRLLHPRNYVYSVLLPDQTVLILGGKSGRKDTYNLKQQFRGEVQDMHHPDAAMEPELYNPRNNKWKPMAPMNVDRLYNANALLLPDGRVMTAGSNPQRTINELRIEIFRPPYLFRGRRPKIIKCPDKIKYGTEIMIETDDGENIESVALIRPSVTSHCVNTEQRYVGLEFTKNIHDTVNVSVPPYRNLIPPGYYMLFIINKKGVPSIARFVLIN
jgi:hypothetical protein